MLMSLQPRPWPEPAPEEAAAGGAPYRRRETPLPVTIRDRRGELCPDGQFAAAFGARGRPGWSPGRLALVTVLQMAENLTDRQATEAVRDKISWKYALGLELDDQGFDASVLAEFRSRVVAAGLEQRALDLLLAALVAEGLITPGGRARTDSTHVVAAVRNLNRLELAGESVRACAEGIAAAAPNWLATAGDVSDWARRYGARIDSWRLPASATKRAALAATYGARRSGAAAHGVRRQGTGLAARAARRGRAAPGAGAELPDHHRRPRTEGDPDAGGRHRRPPARQAAADLSL